MATIWTRDWTGTNGTAWTTASFTALVTSGAEALIQSNTGWGPAASGTERIYTSTAYPQTTGYEVDLDATWNDAAGTGRWVGIALRATTDGVLYSVELDSNVGTTRCRIRRRAANGSWTTVTAYASPAGIPASAALNSGVTMTGRVENTAADEVTVSLYYGATLLATYVDTSASRIESGGTAGVVVDANWTDDDIVVDSLICRDFAADWAGSGSLDEGIALIVDGTYYSWEDLAAEGITVGMPRQSYTLQAVCTFSDTLKLGETSTVLYSGAVVTVSLDGNVVAFGRLRTASESWDTKEGRQYELVGPKQLATDVLVVDPEWGTDLIRFNMPTDAEDYHPDRADKEIGEAIAYLIDNHLDGDGNLRDQLAAPPDGDAYTQAELDAMTAILPELEVRGDVVASVESLLSYTKYALYIHPDTRKWEFHVRNSGTIQTVDVGTTFAAGETQITPDRNATAIVVVGSRPETTLTTFTNAAGLTSSWPSGLESTHNWATQHKNRDTGIVDTTGTAGGLVTMTPTGAFSMVADEWIGCRLEFTSGVEDGNTYDVDDNSGSTFTLDAGSWTSGGPSALDTFEVRGNKANGGKDNGYSAVGRRFSLSNADLGIPPDACGVATITSGGLSKQVKFTHSTIEGDAAEIELDMPAIGVINQSSPSSPADTCTDGQAVTLATVEVTIPTYDRTDPSVPRYRYPTAGFYGDAYTVDSDKWSGGGKPGRGDPAVMRTYPIPIPAYDGSAAQDTEIAKLAADVLAVLSPLSREVRITVAGFDFNFLNLDARLQITRTGGSTGVWSSLENLGVLAVEYDPLRKTTTIHAGTQASWEYDIEGMRRGFLERSRIGHEKDATQKLRELLECMNGNPKGSGEVGQIAPVQICAAQVSVPTPGGGAQNLEDVVTNDEQCTVGAMPATTPCTNACPTPAPISNVSQAGTNATGVQGTGGGGSGTGAKIKEFRPPGQTGAADDQQGENNVADAICCLAEHVQGLWLSDEVIASGVNDVAAVVSAQLVLMCAQINSNSATINQIISCIQNNVQAYTSAHPVCTLDDPGTISACDTCPDYCTTAIPAVTCGLDTPL